MNRAERLRQRKASMGIPAPRRRLPEYQLRAVCLAHEAAIAYYTHELDRLTSEIVAKKKELLALST
jgi:hypothetical protein